MKKYVLVALAALTLSGCLSRPPEPDQPLPPVTVEPDQPNPPVEQPQPPTSEPVPQPPKIQQLDWLGSVQPLVGQMLKADGVTAGSVLLLDSVKNNTNGSLQMGKATAALYKALASNSTFSVVPEAKLTSARQTLGLSADDSFGSRSKAIGPGAHRRRAVRAVQRRQRRREVAGVGYAADAGANRRDRLVGQWRR